jgi:hypothetical protein
MKRLIRKKTAKIDVVNFLEQIAMYQYANQMNIAPDVLKEYPECQYVGIAFRAMAINANISNLSEEEAKRELMNNIVLNNEFVSWSKTESALQNYIPHLDSMSGIKVIIKANITGLDLATLSEIVFYDDDEIGAAQLFTSFKEVLASIPSDYQVYKIL